MRGKPRNHGRAQRPGLAGPPFYHVTCYHCASVFGMPDKFDDHLRNTGDSFWCPICGGSQAYNKGKSEEDRLREQLDEQRRARERAEQQQAMYRDEAESERRRAAAARGRVTKIKRRVGKGVCPCCNRTFQNLHKHMETQHPEYADGDLDGGREDERKTP